MRFEQALQAMREGKKVKRPIQSNPRAIVHNMIVEVFKWNPRENEVKDWYEPLDGLHIENIMAEDWEIIEDEKI